MPSEKLIKQIIPDKPIGEKGLMPFVERELTPLIKAMRRTLNAILSEYMQGDIIIPFASTVALRPPSLSATYQDVDTTTGTPRSSVYFAAGDYRTLLFRDDLALSIYLEVVLSSSGAGYVAIRLHNATTATAVDGTETVHAGTAETRYLIGPIDFNVDAGEDSSGSLTFASSEYRIQGMDDDATEYAMVRSARFIVRYESNE